MSQQGRALAIVLSDMSQTQKDTCCAIPLK